VKYSKDSLLLIGSGPWVQKIKVIIKKCDSTIEVNSIPAREFLEIKASSISDIINNQIIWIATTPQNQIEALKKIVLYRNKVIIEKPFATRLKELNILLDLSENTQNQIFLSEPWRHSTIWSEIKRIILESRQFNEIIIHRGGPTERSYINQVWDWLPHDVGLVSELVEKHEDILITDYVWSNKNKNIKLLLEVKGLFSFEINSGHFLKRTESWEIGKSTLVDFSSNNYRNDNPVYNMLLYVFKHELNTSLAERLWLTEKVINTIN